MKIKNIEKIDFDGRDYFAIKFSDGSAHLQKANEISPSESLSYYEKLVICLCEHILIEPESADVKKDSSVKSLLD